MDRADPARGRLAVLSSHLLGDGADSAAVLKRSPVSAAHPATRAGVLAVVDTRTGKRYEVKVSGAGTVRSTDLKKITTGKDDKGLKTYDPGYLNTAPACSSISYIGGDEGVLRYRGYPIEEVAENSSFLEVAYLLMYGDLPTQSQLAGWEFAISQHSAVPQGLLACF